MARRLPPRAGRMTVTRPGPASTYVDRLSAIKEADDRDWRELARFDTAKGASDALHRIRVGLRPIPLGKWEFRAERTGATSRLLVLYRGRGTSIAWWRGLKVREAETRVAHGLLHGAGVGRGGRIGFSLGGFEVGRGLDVEQCEGLNCFLDEAVSARKAGEGKTQVSDSPPANPHACTLAPPCVALCADP